MLYSYKRNYTQELPEQIWLSDGRPRSDISTFTLEEITDAGYVEVNDPPIFDER